MFLYRLRPDQVYHPAMDRDCEMGDLEGSEEEFVLLVEGIEVFRAEGS